VHKPGFPIRPIVSGIDSPTQRLTRYLLPILNPLVGKTQTYVKNSEHLIQKVTDFVVPPGAVLGSFDVVNLFTTTPVPETLDFLERKLRADASLKERTHHPVETILNLLKL
jgi:hypothetical protein